MNPERAGVEANVSNSGDTPPSKNKDKSDITNVDLDTLRGPDEEGLDVDSPDDSGDKWFRRSSALDEISKHFIKERPPIFSGPKRWYFPREKEGELIEAAKAASRQPILDRKNFAKYFDGEYPMSSINRETNRQWVQLTGIIMREMHTNPATRDILKDYIKIPLSEGIVMELINKLGEVSPDIEQAWKQSDKLEQFLSLPSVPEEVFVDNIEGGTGQIRNARILEDPKKMLMRLENEVRSEMGEYQEDPEDSTADKIKEEELTKRFLQKIDDGEYKKAITCEEKALVIERYRMGRDLKLLMLGAELAEQDELETDQGDSIKNKGNRFIGRLKRIFSADKPLQLDEESGIAEVNLNSGINIGLCSDNRTLAKDLLNPKSWISRRGEKDRIHFAEVGDSSTVLSNEKVNFVIKERKMKRHRDTKTEVSNDARTEIAIALEMQERGQSIEGQIKVSWEKPVGFVEFPDELPGSNRDSFQIALFEKKSGLGDKEKIAPKLLEHFLKPPIREEIEKEYKDWIDIKLPKMVEDPDFNKFVKNFYSETEEYQGMYQVDDIKKAITFEKFAMLKISNLVYQAFAKGEESKYKAGFEDKDSADSLFRIPDDIKPGGPYIEFFGFDMEYWEPLDDPNTAASIIEEKRDERLQRVGRYSDIAYIMDRDYVPGERNPFKAHQDPDTVFALAMRFDFEKQAA